MENFLKKIKIWYQTSVTKNPSYSNFEIKPNRDWLIILISLCIGLCLSGTIAFYLYVHINDGTLFNISKTNSVEKVQIDSKLLKKTIDDITIRHAAAELFKQNNLNFPDPSL